MYSGLLEIQYNAFIRIIVLLLCNSILYIAMMELGSGRVLHIEFTKPYWSLVGACALRMRYMRGRLLHHHHISSRWSTCVCDLRCSYR